MERRMKSKQTFHTRSKSLGEEPVESVSPNHLPRQTTYDDYHTRKMEVDADQDVWMNSFSSWKMRRMKATSTERDRKAERDEVEETQERLKKKKSKTFREIVEEKQRREKLLQSGSIDVGSLDAGELTQIVADLPSTNLDSDNEQEIPKPEPVGRTIETRREERKLVKEPDRKKEIRQRSNTLPSNYPKPEVKITKVPPPVKPKPRSRSGSLRNRSNSVGEKLYEPEVITATNTYTTYASPPPSMQREDPKPVTRREEPRPVTRSEELRPVTRSEEPRPVTRREELRPVTRREEPRPVTRSEEPRPVTRREEPRQVVNREEPRPAMEQEASRETFHDRVMKARQREQEVDLNEQKAKEEARKPYKPRKSSIFAKIRAFDTGKAFEKANDVDGDNHISPRFETKPKLDVKEDDDYEDLVIIMSQRKMSQRGFGFQTSGGYDEGKPLVVSKVTTGSVADYSDLKVGDHILSINKENTRRFNQDDVQQCLSQSILTGKLTCKVRRYPDGKVPVKAAPASEPVLQRSSAPKVESHAPPVRAPPRTQPVPVHRPVPVHQPVRKEPPEPAKVVERPEKDHHDEDIDVLRPDPTRNALARARQMLDKLEMDDDESSSRSSDTVDHSPVSSRGSSSYTSHKPLHSQPPQTNGYHAPHEENSEYDEAVVSVEDETDGPSLLKLQDLKNEKEWFLNASMEVAVGSQSSLQGSEDRFSTEGFQSTPSKVDLSPGSVEADQGLNESFSQSEDFDDNESGVAPLNMGSDDDDDDDNIVESADHNSVDDESVSSEDVRPPSSWNKQSNRPTLQSQIRINSPPSSLDEEGHYRNQESQPQFKFKSFSVPKPYKVTDNDPPGRENAAPGSDSDDQTKKRDNLYQRRSEFFIDEDGNLRPAEELDGRLGEVEEQITAQNEDTTEMMPVRRPIKPHTAHRKPFNREEERKRLEKWNEEQEKRRREKYELEQQRLKEEQERAMEMALEDIQKKREEEEKALEEKRRMMQKQQEEMREMRQKQMEEEENRRKAKLEQERLAWEETERQRQEDEKRREREREEEQRRERERLERERILREAAEKERQEREKERKEQEERERLQREREERERAAKEKIRKEKEEYARMLKEREKERQEQERLKAEEEQRRQEEEDAERERLQVEKWKKDSEERDRAAREKLEQDRAQQEEVRRRLEEEERARIREEEREKMRREWEVERKRELDQLQKEKDKLQKEKEALAKKHEEERQMLRAERDRMVKEKDLGQKKTSQVIEEPIGKMTNGDVMSSPPKTELEVRHSPRNSHSPRTVSPGTQRIKENNQKNMVPERDHPSSHSIMSHYKDPNIPTSQHWLFEEAERRRRAEEQGVERKMPPDVVIPPQRDMGPPQKPPHSIPRHSNAYPRGFEPEHPTRIPPQRKEPEMPVSNTPAMRRMRKPEAEADRQRKMQNRRSLPDLGGGRDSAVPSNGYREDPSSRNSARTSESPVSRSSERGQHSIPGQGSAFQEPNKSIPPNQAVSGKLQCCNCGKYLGRGAAMIIESLGLHYHLECFRCCVCSIQLGNGTKGTDVRIRASQLHCQNCYSNEAGFQFTEV